MKVKIKKSTSQAYWYSNKIGQTFEVLEYDTTDYITINDVVYILKKDCEIVTDYTIPGTKIPCFTKSVVYYFSDESGGHKFHGDFNFISYGTYQLFNKTYIKCEVPNYTGDLHYLISLEDLEQLTNTNTNTNTMSYQITPNQAKSIIEIACNTWKKKLAEKWAVKIMLDETIEVSDEFHKEMIFASNSEQITLLKSIFKSNEINLRDKSTINGLELFEPDGNASSALIAIRESYEYKDKAFYLNNEFDWKLDRDGDNALCLIPTKHK